MAREPDGHDIAYLRNLAAYNAHRQELRSAGYDPDFIGVTEVRQVCCQNCGKPIPWRVLKGWQD